MIRARTFILIAALSVSAAAGAAGLSGRNSFETLSLTYNARFFSLAGAGIALVDDVNAGMMNSSRLVSVRGLEFSVSANSHFGGSMGGMAAFAYPMPFGVFGASFVYFNYGRAELRAGDTEIPDEVWSPSDLLAVVSFGNSLGRNFAYGINLKYVQEALTDDETMFGFAADLNAFFNDIFTTRLDLGLTINNLGVITRQGYRDNNLPIAVVAGLAYAFELDFPAAGIYDIKPCLDLELTADLKPRVLFGSEFCWYHVANDLNITGRVGFAWPSDPGILTGFRLGVGADFRNISVDYGIGWMGDLGFVHKISATFKLKTPEPKRFVEAVTRKRIEKDLEDFNKAFDKKTEDKPRKEKPAPQTAPQAPPKKETIKNETPRTNVPPAGDDEFDFEE